MRYRGTALLIALVLTNCFGQVWAQGPNPGAPAAPSVPEPTLVDPSFKLAVRQLTVKDLAGTGVVPLLSGKSVSDASFFLDLLFDSQGNFAGQTMVPRKFGQWVQSLTAEGSMQCVDIGTWTERWQAFGVKDSQTNDLVMKLRFDQGEITIRHRCCARGAALLQQRGVTKQPERSQGELTGDLSGPVRTQQGFSSDSVRTGLERFTMPAAVGAQKHFEWSFGKLAKDNIDVAVVPKGARLPKSASLPTTPDPCEPAPSPEPGGVKLEPTDERALRPQIDNPDLTPLAPKR